MPAEITLENQLVADLVSYWNTTPPTGLANGVAIVDFRRIEALVLPALIVGHEGSRRETAKGMIGTGRVAFRVAVRTQLDVTSVADHREMVSVVDDALLALQRNVLALSYVHAVLREGAAEEEIEDRRQQTVLSYTVVCTRMQEA